MNCKINEQTVVNKCAEVAQQVHEDFINDNTREFSKENNDIQMFAEPAELLKAGEIKEYVSLCRSLNMSDKDIAKTLIANKLFGQRFEELFNTKEIQDVAQEEGPIARALEVFRDCLGDGIDFESFVKGLLARKDKSTFEKKDAYNSILKKNFPIFKSVKSGKTTFAATAEAVQSAYRDGSDESDNLGADLINDFVNEFSSLRELNDAFFGKKRKLSISERLDYAANIITDELEEQNYFEKNRKSIVSQLINHLQNIGIPIFFKKDMENYFREHPNSVVQDYVRLRMQSDKEITKDILYNHYIKDVKPTQEQIRDYKRFQNAFVNGRYIYDNNKSLETQSKEIQERFPNAIIYDSADTKYAFAKNPVEVLSEKNKKWIDELSDDQLFDEAFRLSEEQMFVTKNGEIYGFVDKDGNIYLDEKIINAEHPIHEYTHLWDRIVAKRNPELWKRGVELMKQTELWNDIANNERYGLKWESMSNMSEEKIENLIASEVHARLVGDTGKIAIGENGDINVIEKLKQWLLDFWKELKATFSNWSKEEIERLTLEDFNNMTLRDFVDGINLIEQKQKQTEQVQQEKERQAQQQQEPIVDPQNKIITSPSVQESQELEVRLNRMFPLPNDSITERVDDTTLILKNIDDVVALYEFLFEKPVLQSITQNSSIQNRTSTTAKSNVTENAIVKLRAMLKEIKAKTEYYFDEYNKENLTPVQKNEIERNYAILTNQKTIIENILKDIDTESIDNVLDNIDKLLDMYENLFALLTEEKTKGEYNMMTDMSVFYIVRRTLGIGEEFFGDFRDAYEEITKSNSEIDERTKKQMYRWTDINENKNKFYKQLVDDLLNRYDFSQDEDYKTGFNKKWKTNLERQSRKGINDIVGLDKLLFAFDNVMGENTMLNRFLANMAEKTLLDSFNEGNEMSERLDKINLKLKNIGVDLGDIASYYDVFLEKLKDGTRTWKLKTFAKPEFFSYMRSFYREEVYDRDYDQTDKRDISIQRKKLNSILNDIDVVNIFKFKEAHDRNSELFSLLRSISSYVVKDKDGNIKLNDDESVVTESEWEKIMNNPAFAYDEQYEKELERKLGPEYERVMRQYISLFIETVKKDGRTLDNGVIVMRDGFDKADNPFFIMQNIIRSKKVVSSVKSIVDEESGRYWDFNNMVYIPNLSKDNLFDSSFGKTFDEDTENGKVLSEAYEIFREIYGDKVGSVYFSDPNNRSMAMIKPEGFADIITTAWSLPISKRKRILKIIQQEWELFKSHFWRDKNVPKDSQKVNKNYTDEYNKSYSRVIELLKGFNDKESLLQICDVFGFSTDTIKQATDEESKEIIANKVAEREADFTTDLLKATKNILQLYSIQKTNMIMNEYMELVFTKFSDIKTKSGKDRINAIQQFKDQQDRGFKHQGADKRDLSEAEINLRKDLSEIFETDKDISQKIREIYLDQGLKMTKNEKEIIKYISLILEEQNKANGGFTFSYKGNDYKKMIARTAFGTDRTLYYKNNINITEEDFNKARADFLVDMILELGHQMGIDSLMSGFMDMLRLKMLGGWVAASFSGMKNRVDGIVADSDLDACGIYFTSGNLARAQRFMTFGTLPMGWVDKNGDIALRKLIGEKNYKKFKITKNLGTRMQIMQDMTNVFDKNIANTRVGWLKTNLNAYNTAIQLPEIRNQYDLFIARLMDVKITDKDGNVHKFIENNEFAALDIDENGNTILKDEFNPQKYQEGTQEYENTKKNIQWLTFESETESESKMKQAIGRGDFSDVFKVILDVKKANARANGDYREMFKKMYTASIVGKMIMNFKTYAPERFKRAWSSGNNEDLIGEFTTQLREGGLASFVAIMYSSFNKSGKRVLPRPITQAVEGIMGLGYLGYGLYSNIKSGNMYRGALNRIYYDVLFLRQLFYELWKTPGRFFAKKSSSAVEYLKKSKFLKDDMFTMSETRINSLLKESEFEGKELEEYREYLSKMSEEQRKQHIGNVCSLARGVARQLYELPIKVAAYYLMLMLFKWLFGDDDDDPKETEKHMNFVVMQLKNISESTNLLYQFTGGIMDSYQSVVAWQQLGRIAKSIKGLRNLEYEKNTKKLLKLAVPSVRLWQVTTEYREAPSDFEMIGEQLMGDELDESAYQTEIFSKRYKGIRGQAKLSYIKAYQDKEIPENEANKILKKYKNTEMYKEYKKSHSTDNMTVYDIPMADFENIIPKCLPQRGNKKDMYGHTYKGLSDRDMVSVYQDWFDERKDWLKTPWGVEEYSRNPNMFLDFIRMFQDRSGNTSEKDVDKYVSKY